MFLSAEMMLQGVALTLVGFGRYHGNWTGQVFTIMILTVAACEASIALALIVILYNRRSSLDVTLWQDIREAGLAATPTTDVAEEAEPVEADARPRVVSAPDPGRRSSRTIPYSPGSRSGVERTDGYDARRVSPSTVLEPRPVLDSTASRSVTPYAAESPDGRAPMTRFPDSSCGMRGWSRSSPCWGRSWPRSVRRWLQRAGAHPGHRRDRPGVPGLAGDARRGRPRRQVHRDELAVGRRPRRADRDPGRRPEHDDAVDGDVRLDAWSRSSPPDTWPATRAIPGSSR